MLFRQVTYALSALLPLSGHFSHLTAVNAITVYGLAGASNAPTSTPSVSSGGSAASTLSAEPVGYTPPAFKTLVLTPPPVPDPKPPMQFGVQLESKAENVMGLSIPLSGAFYGFSIEMSIVNQVSECLDSVGFSVYRFGGWFLDGENTDGSVFVLFLFASMIVGVNSGHVNVRVGGNSQDTATLVDSLPNGVVLMKDKGNTTSPTDTPTIFYTTELLYLLANVSSLVNTRWYLGIPMNDTANLRLQIAEVAEDILGDTLLGLQLGNEPDLYASHGHRQETYGPFDYFGEFGTVVQAIQNDPKIPARNNLIAPSVASGPWKPEDVWNTGFLQAYGGSLSALAVEHYPDNNCAAIHPGDRFGAPTDPQSVFANYLNHTSGVHLVSPYLNSTAIAQSVGKPFIMFETNTASCGGFPGISDSFGAGLWALDYGMQMAYGNFSGALLHVGGSDAVYNTHLTPSPLLPAPPTNESTFHEWTIGPVFYSAVIMAEALGNTNTSRIIDLWPNAGNMYTPGYAIYERDVLARVALFNYITDQSGASTYTASLSVGGGMTSRPAAVPAQVYVKYFLAPSVADKSNITWAGQTMGTMFKSDGRFQGNHTTTTVNCDQVANTCNVQVPAPGFALVFFTTDALDEVSPQMPMTFATSALTRTQNTATVDPTVIATSNGHGGADRPRLGSSSRGSVGAANVAAIAPGVAALTSLLAGVTLLLGLVKRF
ncbi:hypothetical protein NLI96_g10822 [Meripilus lineatus]|uniref:Beta-glucuronidase C-terminal domain-containing protein n=1 Tax=Meripilus lineatus TaxID=2056292 RepID=A0AAD5Y8Y7_9APHY|nr:hypothetical protein NLI96_g10822 [Physisporinus lineatus]